MQNIKKKRARKETHADDLMALIVKRSECHRNIGTARRQEDGYRDRRRKAPDKSGKKGYTKK